MLFETCLELKSSLRKFEHENADLKFLNNQYVHRMRSLEQESKQKTERILQLQEKNFNAVVQTPGNDYLCSVTLEMVSMVIHD